MKKVSVKKETDKKLFALFMAKGFKYMVARFDLDETVHQREFRKLVQRVEVLEK